MKINDFLEKSINVDFTIPIYYCYKYVECYHLKIT